MPQSELKRRQKQAEILRKKLEDPEVQADELLTKRIRDSLGETEQRIAEEEQRVQHDAGDAPSRRRR